MVYYINKISDLSDFEYVSIVTSMEIMGDKNQTYQCNVCLNKSSDARRKRFGCKELREKPIPIINYNQRIDFYTCPGNLYDPSVENLLYIHNKFEQGIMPYGGALMDQPAKFIQAMQLIDAVSSRMSREK